MTDEINYLEQTLAILSVLVADASFWTGLAAVVIFSWTRFDQHQRDTNEIDPPVPTRSFTTRFRYHLAALTYTASYGLVFLLLIILGTFPFSQRLLMNLIGTIEGKDIGTPAWAAMAATAILPAFKFFQRADQRLRAVLHDFASIPLKARRLADEIIDGLAVSSGAAEAPSAAYYANIYAALRETIDRLKGSPRLSAQRAYSRFFARYHSVQDDLDRQLDLAVADADRNGPPDGLSPAQWQMHTSRLARLVACSLLQIEADEFKARDVLIRELKIPDIEPCAWRFTNSQILLAIFTVVTAVAGGLVGSSAYKVASYMDTEVSLGLVLAVTGHAILIGALAVPMFVLPLVFAAGVQMYLLDRRQLGTPLEWHEYLLANIFTFGMAYGLALLPAFIVAAIGAQLWDGGSVNILIWLPWAIPPAAVATLFVIVSTIRYTGSRLFNAGLDFTSHAAVAFLTARLAMLLAEAGGFLPDASFGVPRGTISAVAPITAAFAGGALGALQCGISRQSYESAGRQSGPEKGHALSPVIGTLALR